MSVHARDLKGARYALWKNPENLTDRQQAKLGWAQRCRIPSFVELGRRISKHRDAIDAALEHRLSNGLVESTNTKIRLLTRMAFGFKSPEAMIALAMLNLADTAHPYPAAKPREPTHGTSRRAQTSGSPDVPVGA